MKSLKNILESLFDPDLVTKTPNILGFIINEISKYKKFDTSAFKSFIDKFDDVFNLNKKHKANHLLIKSNTLYVTYDYNMTPPCMILIAKGLGGNFNKNYILKITANDWDTNIQLMEQNDEDYFGWMSIIELKNYDFSEYPLSKKDINEFFKFLSTKIN